MVRRQARRPSYGERRALRPPPDDGSASHSSLRNLGGGYVRRHRAYGSGAHHRPRAFRSRGADHRPVARSRREARHPPSRRRARRASSRRWPLTIAASSHPFGRTAECEKCQSPIDPFAPPHLDATTTAGTEVSVRRRPPGSRNYAEVRRKAPVATCGAETVSGRADARIER